MDNNFAFGMDFSQSLTYQALAATDLVNNGSKPSVFSRSIAWVGRALRKSGIEILRRNGIEGTWIDVGAHEGETTLAYAQRNPGLRIFALEPNVRLAAKLVGLAANYFVIPVAIAAEDGMSSFHINEFDPASSLLPFNREGLQSWIGPDPLEVKSTVAVPTMRLETLMNLASIRHVDFLKIDAQGMDLAVVKSAGARLRDIEKIMLEVSVMPVPLYSGAPSKTEVVTFLQQAGFDLATAERQSDGQEENLTFVRRR
jgi:FkbM family methyltransferase